MDQSQIQLRRVSHNEQGAALVMSLLLSTVLLLGGLCLIQLTSLSATNSIDTTSEMQAYYGAEAGIQAALNALRANATPSASAMPAGVTGMSFRNAVTASVSND